MFWLSEVGGGGVHNFIFVSFVTLFGGGGGEGGS